MYLVVPGCECHGLCAFWLDTACITDRLNANTRHDRRPADKRTQIQAPHTNSTCDFRIDSRRSGNGRQASKQASHTHTLTSRHTCTHKIKYHTIHKLTNRCTKLDLEHPRKRSILHPNMRSTGRKYSRCWSKPVLVLCTWYWVRVLSRRH